jgi:hypothetical protein
MPFVDDVGVKGPYNDYNGEESLPGIRWFMLEYIQNLDKVLERIKRAGASISGLKSQFYIDGMNVVGFVYGAEGRSPASLKVIKILEWEGYRDPTEAKSFLGICTYYRIWIKGFGEIAALIYRLMRKGVKWHWGPKQEQAMERLKLALTSAPILIKLDYGIGAGDIVLGVDTSLVG